MVRLMFRFNQSILLELQQNKPFNSPTNHQAGLVYGHQRTQAHGAFTLILRARATWNKLSKSFEMTPSYLIQSQIIHNLSISQLEQVELLSRQRILKNCANFCQNAP
ncbi:MAG: hypothetical protein DWH74_00300 [Planctomycetota bacterium]|nr:MAG: hypothetical protein DWH74_00300 [Planctomycetota bacterium]